MLAKLRARRTGFETTTPASDDDAAGDNDAAGDDDAVVIDRSFRVICVNGTYSCSKVTAKG